MRTAGMIRGGTGASCLLLVLTIGYVYALPLQLLPEVPGYIPVYIRHGDQPLEEINPALAEAFHERNGHSKNVRQTHSDQVSRESDTSLSSDEDDMSVKNEENIYVISPVKPFSMNKLHADNNDMVSERLHRRQPIEVPKNSVLKVAEISDDEERELASLVAEIEREETKPNDLYDTNDSNPLYSSQTHDREINRHISHEVESKKIRPVSKWVLTESEETQRNTKEHGPVTYDHIPNEPSLKQNSSEEDYSKRIEKLIDESDESEPKTNSRDFGIHSDERISDEIAEE